MAFSHLALAIRDNSLLTLLLLCLTAVLEFKVILATLIRTFEFHDTKAVVHQRISPTLQPVVDGVAGILPLHVTLAST